MELTHTDQDGRRVGVIRSFSIDLAYGQDENDLLIKLPIGQAVDVHGYAYIDGTEWGGVVDGEGVESGDDNSGVMRTYSGRTWHGIIAGRVVVPDGDHYVMEGEANAAIRALLDHVGLGDPFAVQGGDSGLELSYTVPRFADAYTAIRGALASAGARLDVVRRGGRTWLSAVPASVISMTGRGSVRFSASSNGRPVNHLVCAGQGELSDRVVVHLYADDRGVVSREQSLFGVDEVAALYDSNNSDESQLVEDGTKRLEEIYDAASVVSLDLPDGIEAHVGDRFSFIDLESGTRADAGIGKVVLSIGGSGVKSVSYGKVDESVSRILSTGSGGGTSSGTTLVAGEGIRISGGVISAEVGADDLGEVRSTAAGARSTASEALAAAEAAGRDASSALSAASDAALEASGAAASADSASSVASGASKAAQEAKDSIAIVSKTVDAKVGSVAASDPIVAERTGDAVSLSLSDAGVYSGQCGPEANATPGFGDTVDIGARITVDRYGRVQNADGRSLTVPSSIATSEKAGLMSPSDKGRLDAYPWGDLTGVPEEFPPADHSHRYAASEEAGGPATSALKCTGNSDTASRLETPRTISVSGAVSGSAVFDGSSDISIAVNGGGADAAFGDVWRVGMLLPASPGFDPNGISGTWVRIGSDTGPVWWKRVA